MAAKKNRRHGECQGERGGEVLPAPPQQPRSAKSDNKDQDGENRRTAQRGKSLRRQIENVRHREPVGVQVVILQQVRDAALRRNIERSQDQVAQAHRGQQPDHGQSRLQARQPAVAQLASASFSPIPQQDGNRRPGAEAVVLHARSAGQRKEKQNQPRPDEQQQTCLLDRFHLRSPGLRTRKFAQGVADEKAPGKEPHQVQRPPQQKRHGFIVRRVAGAEGALEMLVDEVRPQKSGRALFRDPVPGHGDDQKNQGAGKNPQFAPASPAAGEQDKEKDHAERKQHADQAQGKRGQRHHDRRAPVARRACPGCRASRAEKDRTARSVPAQRWPPEPSRG